MECSVGECATSARSMDINGDTAEHVPGIEYLHSCVKTIKKRIEWMIPLHRSTHSNCNKTKGGECGCAVERSGWSDAGGDVESLRNRRPYASDVETLPK